MPKRTRDYRTFLLKRLADPNEAESYLNVAITDSHEIFLKALRNVAEARRMSKVAKEAGVSRESLYRTLSEDGNPRFDTLTSVLSALGLRLKLEVFPETSPAVTRGGSELSLDMGSTYQVLNPGLDSNLLGKASPIMEWLEWIRQPLRSMDSERTYIPNPAIDVMAAPVKPSPPQPQPHVLVVDAANQSGIGSPHPTFAQATA